MPFIKAGSIKKGDKIFTQGRLRTVSVVIENRRKPTKFMTIRFRDGANLMLGADIRIEIA